MNAYEDQIAMPVGAAIANSGKLTHGERVRTYLSCRGGFRESRLRNNAYSHAEYLVGGLR
jgi:hypothetical protein